MSSMVDKIYFCGYNYSIIIASAICMIKEKMLIYVGDMS
jgi:hypothetical protein